MRDPKKSIGANVGEMLAIAMAEGGMAIAKAACRFTNMTDGCYLAGVKFPADIGKEVEELLVWFNRETSKMCEFWDERDEEARYCLIGEILVKLVDGEDVGRIRKYIEGKLVTIRKNVRDATRDRDHDDDIYGFDEDSIYLRENNWGDHMEEETDWWTRKAS